MDFFVPLCRSRLSHSHYEAVYSLFFQPKKNASGMSVGSTRRSQLTLPNASDQTEQKAQKVLSNPNKTSLSGLSPNSSACLLRGKKSISSLCPFLEDRWTVRTPQLLPIWLLKKKPNLLSLRPTIRSESKILPGSDSVLNRQTRAASTGSFPCVAAFGNSGAFLCPRFLHSSPQLAISRGERAGETRRHAKTRLVLSFDFHPATTTCPRNFSEDIVHRTHTVQPSSTAVSRRLGRTSWSSSSPSLFHHHSEGKRRRKSLGRQDERRCLTTTDSRSHSNMADLHASEKKVVSNGDDRRERKLFSPGLEGVIAGESSISAVNEDAGGKTMLRCTYTRISSSVL